MLALHSDELELYSCSFGTISFRSGTRWNLGHKGIARCGESSCPGAEMPFVLGFGGQHNLGLAQFSTNFVMISFSSPLLAFSTEETYIHSTVG